MTKYIGNTKSIYNKLSNNVKHKNPNQSFILKKVYVIDSANFRRPMRTINVNETINEEV